MLRLEHQQAQALHGRFLPDRPGPLVGLHVLHTGHGTIHVDRWPDPWVILAGTGGNYAIQGHANALRIEDLPGNLAGYMEAPETFLPLLEAAYPMMQPWNRVILALEQELATPQMPDAAIRPLGPEDTPHLAGLSREASWIGVTWGGPQGLAASGYAWGAFVQGKLASVACTFFLGERYEEIGVVTEPGFRGRGLSTACAAALCRAIRSRGRIPSWSTSPDNLASLRVAKKLGFVHQRDDVLYMIHIPMPPIASRD